MTSGRCLALISLACCFGLAWGQPLLASGRIAGRYDPDTGLAALPLVVDWPSTTVWAAFENSDSVQVLLEAQPGFTAQINTSMVFLLDGQPDERFVTTQDLPFTWSRQGLSRDVHEFQIIKRTETLYGVLVLDNITIASSGRFIIPTIPEEIASGRRIMTLGNSIASGWGNVGNISCGSLVLGGTGEVLDPATEDATRSFAALVADYFVADRQILAWSGATQNPFPSSRSAELARVTTPTVPQLFDELIAGNKSSTLTVNTSAWQPQIVLMEGGINDFTQGQPLAAKEDWANQYIQFINEVRSSYRQPEIIVISFPREMALVGILDSAKADTYLDYMTGLGEQLERQRISGAHLLQLDGLALPVQGWCAAHPNAAAHEYMADEIIDFIEQILPNYGNATFPSALNLPASQ